MRCLFISKRVEGNEMAEALQHHNLCKVKLKGFVYLDKLCV